MRYVCRLSAQAVFDASSTCVFSCTLGLRDDGVRIVGWMPRADIAACSHCGLPFHFDASYPAPQQPPTTMLSRMRHVVFAVVPITRATTEWHSKSGNEAAPVTTKVVGDRKLGYRFDVFLPHCRTLVRSLSSFKSEKLALQNSALFAYHQTHTNN